MLKLALLFLALSGLQAVPIAAPRGLQKTASNNQLPDISETNRRGDLIRTHSGNGFGEMDRQHWLTNEDPDDIPVLKIGGSWMRVEELSSSQLADGFRQGTEPSMKIPDGFRQGTEPFMKIPDGFRQGTEPFMKMSDGFRQGTEPFMKMPDDFRQGTEPFMKMPDDFRQGTEPFMKMSDGFRQGTEPFMKMPDDFRQGTEPFMKMPDDFRQGTEPFMKMPDDFRQGTEPFMKMSDGFRQGTEPFMKMPDDFRQGTEPFMKMPDDFRQGTEPFMKMSDGFRQGTEPFMKMSDDFRQGTEPSVPCKGVVISGNCYEFIPTPLAFQDAQALCRKRAPKAELASVSSDDLHSRLVSLATNGGKNTPVLTWLGGTVKDKKGSWTDGSEMSYTDWMPGHPNIQGDKPACVEMFKIDERWWTAADCELKRASICSYPASE